MRFYGSGGEVRKVKIKDTATGKTSKADYFADNGVFASGKDLLVFEDINFDGTRDLLILCADDADGDVHYAAYIYENGKYIATPNGAGEKVACLTNYTVNWEKQAVISEKTEILTEIATNMNAELDFERRSARVEYRWIDGKLTAVREQRISYYFIDEICAYSIYEYNVEAGELVIKSENWFEPEMLDGYHFAE